MVCGCQHPSRALWLTDTPLLQRNLRVRNIQFLQVKVCALHISSVEQHRILQRCDAPRTGRHGRIAERGKHSGGTIGGTKAQWPPATSTGSGYLHLRARAKGRLWDSDNAVSLCSGLRVWWLFASIPEGRWDSKAPYQAPALNMPLNRSLGYSQQHPFSLVRRQTASPTWLRFPLSDVRSRDIPMWP